MQIFRYRVIDEKTASMIHGRVESDRTTRAFSGCPFPNPNLRQGGLFLGSDWQNRPVLIPTCYLNAHSLTVSGTGSGKTVKARSLLVQVAPQVRGLLVVDLRKREFRVLRDYLRKVGVDLIVVPARRLKLNPLQVPQGVVPQAWASRVAGMLVQVLNLPPRASTTLNSKLIELYRSMGTIAGSSNTPVLFELADAIANDPDVNPQAKAAFLDAVHPILLSLGPEVLAHRVAWSSEDLSQRCICLELGDVGEVEKGLIINSLLLGEFIRRVTLGVSNPRMDWFIVLDEAQRICSASRASGGLSDLLGVVRGCGIGLDLSVQSTHDPAPQVLSNTAIKWLGRVGSFTDASAIGAAMGLSSQELRWAATHLQPGTWICQVGEGSERRPFVLRTPRSKLRADVGDPRPPLDDPNRLLVAAQTEGSEEMET
jgi:hypothetical protein